VDGQPAGTTASIFCIDYNTTSDVVVIDHFFIMIPKHVLWRLWTLKTDSKNIVFLKNKTMIKDKLIKVAINGMIIM